MALQFSLASVNPAGLSRGIDFPGIEQKQLNVERSRMDVAEQQRQTAEAAQTRGAFDEYLKQGGDLFTPTGLQKATVDLKGKIPVSEYMKLGPALQKAQEADVKYRTSLQKLSDDELAGQLGIFSTAGPAVTAAYDVFEKTKKDKGDVTALAEFESTRNNLVAQYGPIWSKSPYGQQALKTLSGITPDQVPMLNRMSGYSADALKQEAERRQIELRKAQAEALSTKVPTGTENLQSPDGRVVANIPGKGLVYTDDNKPYEGSVTELKPLPTARTGGTGVVEQYRTPDGATYRVSTRTGATEKINPDGTATPVPGLPADAAKIGSATANRAMEMAKVPELSDEENAKLAEYTAANGGKPIPVPSFGTGASASKARTMFLRNFIADMQARGETPTQAGIRSSVVRASQDALKRLTTTDTVLRSEEGEAIKLLDQVEQELKKIGGVASPYLREKWNTVETKFLGDPKFVRLNTLMGTFIETMGRLSSGATGAAGTPVAYLKFAKDFANKDFNLEQLQEFKPTFEDFVKARRSGVKSALDNLTAGMMPPRKEAKTEDSDAATIIRKEYDDELAKLPTSKDRAKTLENLRSIRRELERLKAPLPPLSDLGEPTAAAKPAAGDIQAQVTKAFGKYEPDVYEYRVSPEGKVQRRKK